MYEKKWHGSVGITLTAKDGTYCGYLGMAYPCSSQEDGWSKGIEWLRKHGRSRSFDFLIHTFKLEVKYF